MTDKRIEECAVTLREVLFRLFPAVEHLSSTAAETEITRAVILKWLEQGPTPKMSDAGESGIPYEANSTEDTYTAMCAQARKEISE